MSFSRYNKNSFVNSNPIYDTLFIDKKLPFIRMSEQKKLKPFSVEIARNLHMEPYVWKATDKLYNVSARFYQTPKLFWLILWANKKGIEQDITVGEVIYIPIPPEKAISLALED